MLGCTCLRYQTKDNLTKAHAEERNIMNTAGTLMSSSDKFVIPKNMSNLSDSQIEMLSRVGLKLFFRMSKKWKVKQEDQLKLLDVYSRATLANWKRKIEEGDSVPLSKDKLYRLSLFAGIKKAIELLYPKEVWDSIVNEPSQELGMSMIDYMLQGNIEDIQKIRNFLDSRRGCDFG